MSVNVKRTPTEMRENQRLASVQQDIIPEMCSTKSFSGLLNWFMRHTKNRLLIMLPESLPLNICPSYYSPVDHKRRGMP